MQRFCSTYKPLSEWGYVFRVVHESEVETFQKKPGCSMRSLSQSPCSLLEIRYYYQEIPFLTDSESDGVNNPRISLHSKVRRRSGWRGISFSSFCCTRSRCWRQRSSDSISFSGTIAPWEEILAITAKEGVNLVKLRVAVLGERSKKWSRKGLISHYFVSDSSFSFKEGDLEK